jgi:3-oxoacyl-[acyl-carrier-protein] synthase-3
MKKTKIAGIGKYLPENIVTNNDLLKYMETSDAWIQERTGIQERRYAHRTEETTTTMAVEASKIAIERAGIANYEVDFVIFATLSPDFYFPGPGVLVQKELGLKTVGALDVRNQCSGFVYAISIADQYIKTGMYKNVLVIGSEVHSVGLDMTNRGRGVSVIFGDGAGAAVLSREEDNAKGILSTHLHSEGQFAEELIVKAPGMGGRWITDILADKDPENDVDIKNCKMLICDGYYYYYYYLFIYLFIIII